MGVFAEEEAQKTPLDYHRKALKTGAVPVVLRFG